MSLHVQSEVVRPGKGPVALLALERPVARVFPVVARELVGAGELPAAALPVAVVRLLPWWKRRQPLGPRQKKTRIKLVRGGKEVPPVLQPATAPARGLNINLLRCTCPPHSHHPTPLLLSSNLPTSRAPLGLFAPISRLNQRKGDI